MSRLLVLGAAIFAIIVVFLLLRSGRLREKYVALWVVVGGGIVLLAIFPRLLQIAADLLHFRVPSNLLFVLSIVMLLGIIVQLSLELSAMEEETRTLAEHVAILDTEVSSLRRQVAREFSVAASELKEPRNATVDRLTGPIPRLSHKDLTENDFED